MTDLSNEVSRHKHAHNYTNVQETETLHTTNCGIFFNIDFQHCKGGSTFSEKKIKILDMFCYDYI